MFRFSRIRVTSTLTRSSVIEYGNAGLPLLQYQATVRNIKGTLLSLYHPPESFTICNKLILRPDQPKTNRSLPTLFLLLWRSPSTWQELPRLAQNTCIVVCDVELLMTLPVARAVGSPPSCSLTIGTIM